MRKGKKGRVLLLKSFFMKYFIMFVRLLMFKPVVIEIPDCETSHLVDWLRFIIDARNKRNIFFRRHYVFDFTKASFLMPFHLVSLACLIEEYKESGNSISFKYKKNSKVEKFLKHSKFDSYWRDNFDRDFCLRLQTYSFAMPIWQYKQDCVDAFGIVIQKFYASHFKGKDLTPLKSTVVEALNNITDHAKSKVSGFVATQYFPKNTKLVISICDFGIGIPNNVNEYLKREGKPKLDNVAALEQAVFQGFSTFSKPHNRGYGLDTILSIVKASNGEIEIVSNKAYYSQQIVHNSVKKMKHELGFSFPGTYLIIKLNTSTFIDIESENQDEISIL